MAGKAKRKNPETTTQYIVGLIDSSVYVEKYADECVRRPYYSGILQSALLLTALAAELALKLAFENENPNEIAPELHYLDDLYSRLTPNKKEYIEKEYSRRIGLRVSSTIPGWQTAEDVFRTGRALPVVLRFLTEEGQSPFEIHPNFLREAVCCVLGSVGTNVMMSTTISEHPEG